MRNGFGSEVPEAVALAERMAAGEGAEVLEARHLLLALAANPESTAGRALASVGIDTPSLGSCGTTPIKRWAPSALEAMHSCVGVAAARRAGLGVRGVDLLLAVIALVDSDVDRLLTSAGVSRGVIRTAVDILDAVGADTDIASDALAVKLKEIFDSETHGMDPR